MSISIIVLFAFLIIVSIWDMRTFEIPDAFLLLGIGAGLVVSFIENEWSGVFASLMALFWVFLITFGIWVVGELFFGQSIIGAGDMKLLSVIALFLGVQTTMVVFYWSILLAGFLFLFMIHPKQIIGLFRGIYHFFVYAIPKSAVSTKKLAFSVPITMATVLTVMVI